MKQRNACLKILLVGAFMLIAGAACDNTTVPSSQSDQSLGDSLRTMLADVVSEFDVPGASIAVKFTDGSVFQYSTGVADRKSAEPLTMEQYFRIGSATKTFTAVGALLLYQDGLYNLDDPVESLLPDLTEFVPMHGKGITVRMLLNHTSGLEDYVELPYEGAYFVIYTNGHYRTKDNVSQAIFDRAKAIIFSDKN